MSLYQFVRHHSIMLSFAKVHYTTTHWVFSALCLSGRVLQEGLPEEDGGGVQEGQLGLCSQKRCEREHLLTAANWPPTFECGSHVGRFHETCGWMGLAAKLLKITGQWHLARRILTCQNVLSDSNHTSTSRLEKDRREEWIGAWWQKKKGIRTCTSQGPKEI